MDDKQLPAEAAGLPVQGPHRPPGRGSDPVPLRLILLPSGLVVDVTRPEVVIGRHSDVDVRLPLPDVSRRHCRVAWADGSWRIFDLNSLNGVFVNSERVSDCPLRQGDLVRIGGFTFRVQLGGDKDPRSLGVLRSIADALPDATDQRLAS
jgi:pSer/pThr/pTyr-binding forkhead associated (FHA) protein